MSILERVGGDEVVSFKDCPNHCVNGYIFDPYSHKKKLCQHCDELRRKQIQGAINAEDKQDIYTKLNIRKSYTGTILNLDNIIPKEWQGHLEENSLREVWEELEGLSGQLALGSLPTHSLLFNLSSRAYCENAIYPLLLKAYRSGLSTLPLLTPFTILKARKNFQDDRVTDDCTYEDMLTQDVCIILIDSSSVSNAQDAKGLMQQRALSDKPTIIFTNTWNGDVRYLYDITMPLSYTLAKKVSIEVDKDMGIKVSQLKQLMDTVPTTDEDLRLALWTREAFEGVMAMVDELQGGIIKQGHLGVANYGKLKLLLNKKIQYVDPSKTTPHKDTKYGMAKTDFENLKKSLNIL